jgi:serine/threonine-protein kinase
LKHHRQVAVKVLRPELAAVVGPERFLREIEIAANLNHPHILPLFDSGEADEFLYYVMPYVEGESLRSRLNREKQLPVDDALQIAREVADALDYAHSQDVVHRDIKPENILLSRGHALVVDFGIGKALHAAGADQLTQTGVSIGTPAYMSPEQAAGQQGLDGRSDLYALGCVLYEMLAGEPLFSGPTAQAIIAKHISESVTSVLSRRSTVPAKVDDALRRVLAKIPADRFTTGARFAEALVAPAAGSSSRPTSKPSPISGAAEKSIAVLPFVNISADSENEYFSDGITEEIINALAQLPGLHVAARTSAFSFKGENIDLRIVGEKLNVATVLEGSVRKAGNRVRITAQLIDAADGYHLWSERYDRELDDIFAIQDEIASTIADHLKVTLAGGSDQALVKPPTDNLEAYELYLKGRFHLYQRVGASFRHAIECLERAVALDPDYAQAHAGMAETYATLGFYGLRRPNEVMPKAKEEAMRALALDDNLGVAHHALALVKLLHEWDWAGATREFQRALELDPGNAVIRSQYALFIRQGLEGQHEQAIAEGRLALESDPLSAYPKAVVSLIMTVAGEHEEGIRLAQAAASNEPNSFMAYRGLGLACSWQGKHEEAAAALERAVELSDRHQWPVGELLAEYAAQGRWSEAKVLLDELRERSEREYVYVFLATGEALLGDMDTAFEALELAYAERDPTLVLAKYWPGFDLLRGDPRWDELLRRMELK